MPKGSRSGTTKITSKNVGKAALIGKDTNRWDVSKEGKAQAEAQMDRAEPFIQAPLKGVEGSFPTIYGVDLKEKRRQELLRGVAEKKIPGLNNRIVALDDKTIEWIIEEQDRVQLIQRDMMFEASAKQQGLFDNPAGLDYLHKINPAYFQRRRKMAKWLVKTQLKLFHINMEGIRSEEEYNFMLMIAALPESNQRILNQPVHKLNTLQTGTEGMYQKGVWRKAFLPDFNTDRTAAENNLLPFSGAMNSAWGRDTMLGGASIGRGIRNAPYTNALGGDASSTVSAYTGW